MPVHDWTRVAAGIFHDFHVEWVTALKHALNQGILPEGYYAMVEQHAAGYEPDVLALQLGNGAPRAAAPTSAQPTGTGAVLTRPRVQPVGEAEVTFYRRKQKVVAVRETDKDTIVAAIEIVSPGNKSSRNALRSFVDKAAYLLNRQIHLLVLDVFPPGPRDPQGIHGAIWEELTDEVYNLSDVAKPLTLASYEASLAIRAYVTHFAVGEALSAMPLFLEPDGCVEVPLEQTYQQAFAAVPKRWREVLESPRR